MRRLLYGTAGLVAAAALDSAINDPLPRALIISGIGLTLVFVTFILADTLHDHHR